MIMDEHRRTKFPPLDRFLSMQRTGEYDHRQLSYQRLYKEMDRLNAMVRRIGHGELKKMPLEWVDQHSTYRKDKVIGPPPSTPTSQLSRPIGATAGSSGQISRFVGQNA
jgi:hypothetical protein